MRLHLNAADWVGFGASTSKKSIRPLPGKGNSDLRRYKHQQLLRRLKQKQPIVGSGTNYRLDWAFGISSAVER